MPLPIRSTLIDRHLTAGPGHRTAVAGPRGDLPHAEPAGLRNRVAAGPRYRALPEERGAQSGGVVHPPLIHHSYSSLFVVSTRPKEDMWSAQRLGIPAWKAWKEVSA
jgi:hypothetical protein